MNFGRHHIVENPYLAHAQPELRPRDAPEAFDARLRGLGRPVSKVALNGVTDLGPKIGSELLQVPNGFRCKDNMPKGAVCK